MSNLCTYIQTHRALSSQNSSMYVGLALLAQLLVDMSVPHNTILIMVMNVLWQASFDVPQSPLTYCTNIQTKKTDKVYGRSKGEKHEFNFVL